jgi:hypothetical protein
VGGRLLVPGGRPDSISLCHRSCHQGDRCCWCRREVSQSPVRPPFFCPSIQPPLPHDDDTTNNTIHTLTLTHTIHARVNACRSKASPLSRSVAMRMAAPPQEPLEQERKGISEDDPLVQRIRDDVLRETGVELDQLLNPSKVWSA